MLSQDEQKLIELSLDAALKPVYDRLEDIAGPSSKTIGRMLNAMLCTQLLNAVKVYGRATEMLNKAGIPLGPVPLKLLKPILDSASVEEDERMQELWAALLANASAQTDQREVSPAYSTVLGQLSPRDAVILQRLYELSRGTPWPDQDLGTLNDLCLQFSPEHTNPQVLTTIEQLRHHSLITDFYVETRSENSTSSERHYRMAQFGVMFILACEPPRDRS